ncbi:hypothetical protein HF325_006507 [Metschnikowia pulcherrima]|uniref:N-terminal nucleophile aminohydrolase n=1 Tax=Metschnikowia pulcherrima TaxID=27326 RepID=A0A8H7GL25_9ASCO|nr:hypothetical protein HF325_006507 [Metschnikowia pulcherrima]
MGSQDILAIHIGAGRHSAQKSQQYKKLLRLALRKNDILDASRVIEGSPLTNTGVGLSVDRLCQATSDACFIEALERRIVDSLALLDIYDEPYPTSCLHKVLQSLGLEFRPGGTNRRFGLSRPSLLDYRAYKTFVEQSIEPNVEITEIEDVAIGGRRKSLVLRRLKTAFTKFKRIYENESLKCGQEDQITLDYQCDAKYSHKKRRKESNSFCGTSELESALTEREQSIDDSAGIEDTVGYIQVSASEARTRISSSSGGNFYRLPGRISCAGILGSGIGYSCHGEIEVSCMCSGNGDDIIAMSLASYLSESIAEHILESEEWPDLGPYLKNRILAKSKQVAKTAVNANLEEITYVGVLLLVKTPNTTRLVFCHSTESFYFAFRLRGEIETVLSNNPGAVGEFIFGEYKLTLAWKRVTSAFLVFTCESDQLLIYYQ